MLKSALAAGKLDEGDLIKRYSADNKKAAQFLVRVIASQAFSPVLGGMVSLVMIYLIHPGLAFTAMAVGAVLFALEARHVHKAQHYASQQSDAKGEFSSDMYQLTQNLPVLRMFASVPMMKERAYAHSTADMETGTKGARLNIVLTTVQSLFGFMGTLTKLLLRISQKLRRVHHNKLGVRHLRDAAYTRLREILSDKSDVAPAVVLLVLAIPVNNLRIDRSGRVRQCVIVA